MTDDDGQVRFGDQAIALHAVAHRVGAEVEEVGRLGVVIDETVRPEAVDDVAAQVLVPLLERVLAMKPHRAEQA